MYSRSLTRGKKYQTLATDEAKQQYRVRGDNDRIRWFPAYCFDSGGPDTPVLRNIYFDDSATELQTSVGVEVTMELSDGTRRWCVFMTPEALSQCGEWIEGTQIRFHYGNAHIIVAAQLSKDLIEQMLRQIDAQGYLHKCTLKVESS